MRIDRITFNRIGNDISTMLSSTAEQLLGCSLFEQRFNGNSRHTISKGLSLLQKKIAICPNNEEKGVYSEIQPPGA